MSVSGSNRTFLLTVIGVVILGVGLLIAGQLGLFNNGDRVVQNPLPDKTPEPKKPEPAPKDWVKAGDVFRPKSDLTPVKNIKTPAKGERPFLPNPGVVPHLKPETNKATQSVAEALKAPEKLGHRLTVLKPAPPFDREAYEADPESYLNTVEPGRIWQQATGEDAVPIVRPKSAKYYHQVLQGESVNLEAVVAPFAPTTFYSPRLGSFKNKLTTISVAADENGVARATFTASPGTRGEIDVLASSPVHSGQLKYLVKVVVPKKGANAGQNNRPNQ